MYSLFLILLSWAGCMKRVITYGTFDMLHYGHINLLRRAKALGDYLIVALSTDEFNWNAKQKKCYFSYEKRKALLESIRYVDLVIPEENWEQKKSDVREYHIDTFVMGDDWRGKFDFLRELCEVVYLERTPEISTTRIKHDLSGNEAGSGIRAMQLEEIKMLHIVDETFRKNGIPYFLLGGSVLGAVRHKGFIPWDDDMDIGVWRKDFDRAETLLSSLDGYVYEGADNHIVPDAPVGHLHLVNEVYPIRNAPTIDLFALDGLPENQKKWKRVVFLSKWYHLAVLGRPAENHGMLVKCMTWFLLKFIPKAGWKRIKQKTFAELTSIDAESARYVANLFGAWGQKEFFPQKMFASFAVGIFEGMRVPLPANPDDYLRQLYGNYMELPPAEKRVPRHREF